MRKITTFTITAVGMMTALSIVLTRFLVPLSTETLRFSLGNVPIILTGIVCGPLAGGICGVISDIIGCFFNGYAPYPLLTISALAVGVLPPLLLKASKKTTSYGRENLAAVSVVMAVTNLLSSMLWTTFCLHLLYSTPFSVLFVSRIPVTLLRTAAEIIVLYVIFKSHVLERIEVLKK